MEENFDCVKDPLTKVLLTSVAELMQTQKLDDISLTQILEKANVSRSTFYRHFNSKYDLITRSYDHVYEESLDKMAYGMSYEQAFRVFYRTVSVKPVFFKHVMESEATEGLLHFMHLRTYKSLESMLIGNGVDMEDEYNRQVLAGYVDASTGVIKRWVFEGAKESFEFLYNVNFDLMPNMIRKCLIVRV